MKRVVPMQAPMDRDREYRDAFLISRHSLERLMARRAPNPPPKDVYAAMLCRRSVRRSRQTAVARPSAKSRNSYLL